MYKHNKKSGFTLVEVVIYLGVLMLLLALPTSFLLVKNKIYSLKVQKEINDVHSFLIESRQLSRNKNVYGKIMFDILDNRISYTSKYDYSEIKLVANSIYTNMNSGINISDGGRIDTAGTITLTGKGGEINKITIEVSTGKINIK